MHFQVLIHIMESLENPSHRIVSFPGLLAWSCHMGGKKDSNGSHNVTPCSFRQKGNLVADISDRISLGKD